MKTFYAIAAALIVAAFALPARAVDADATSRERGRILGPDTNATTTVTLYTAAGAGQTLAGKVGGSNAVWVSTTSGTNAWVKIAQTAP